MPTLKHLTCHVEWSSSNIPLEEYNATYADGFVSTYIAIPSTPTPFSIHLTSHGYVAPGLAMFVYMDGVYQVNRNRRNLKIPGEGTKRSHTEVDFRVRQKEELLWDGSFEGKEWRFERAKIGEPVPPSGVELPTDGCHAVDSPNGEGEQRAPHDGEYVGTIEVVVLRCLPATDDMTKSNSTSSRTAAHRQMKDESSSSSDEPSGTDHPRFPEVFDGAGETYPALKLKPRAKPKHKFTSKNQSGGKAFGLDGSWDEDTEAKNTTGDTFHWDKPVSQQEGQKSDTWDAWGGPPAPVAEANDKALASRDNPPAPKEEARTNTWGAWSDKPASPPEGEKKEKGAWGVWDMPTIRKEETSKGGIEMTSATSGVWHPSSKKAASGHGSDNGVTSSNSGMHGTTRTEPPRTRRRHSRTLSNHQHQPAMRLRGGAPGSYTVGTPGAGHQTPTVIVNINNGPPADNGPPPPRDWMAEARKEREQSKGKKIPTPPTSPTPPANDPWTTDLPPYDPSQDPAVNGKGDQNGDGSWGRNGNGQQMPGAWDDSGNDGWGNTNVQKDNNDWNATGNNNNNGNNDSLWGSAGNDPFVSAPKDDADANNDSWGNDNNNQDTSWGADNENNNAQDTNWDVSNENGNAQDTRWNANIDNKDQQDDSWGKENDKANDFSWGADNTEPEAKVGSTDPATRKPSDSKAASIFTFGNSKPKQSKVGSVKSKASVNSKNNGWSFNALNSPKKSKKGTPKPNPVPGAWSPPPASPPTSPKSKKNKKSKSSSSPKSSPTLISPTPQPHPKPYWSTWRIHHSPFTDSSLKQEPPPPPYEDPLYAVPRAVARRHGTSHQVQPGKAAPYVHKKNRPQYMDSMENPYAVFEFHYRDKETLERILSLPLEPAAHEKLRLRALSKSELIDAFIQTKTKPSSAGSSQPKCKSKKSNSSRKASASTTSTGKAATLRSNPRNIQEGPDIEVLDGRLRKLETSKTEGEDEGVKGWLEGTDGDWAGNGNGNGNEGGTEENNNNGWHANDNGSTGGNWGGNTKNSKSSRKTTAKSNTKKGKENAGAWGTNSNSNGRNTSNTGGNGIDWNDTSGGGNSGGGNNKNDNDNNAWGAGSSWDKKDDNGGDASGNGDGWNDNTGGGNGDDWNAGNSGDGGGNDWNDTSGGGNSGDWGATNTGGGGGGGSAW